MPGETSSARITRQDGVFSTIGEVLEDGSYDLICVGSGFASSFFLHRYLARAAPDRRVLVLERGGFHPHAWQVAHRQHQPAGPATHHDGSQGRKPWVYRTAFGGGSNCWFANAPRMLPADFRMQTRYGVGRDWPVGYDELEPFYGDAEDLMGLAGPPACAVAPRARPYPQPPHALSTPDRLLQAAYPDLYFPAPSARASVGSPTRPACCGNGVCSLCPIDAKFTVLNGLGAVYRDPRVRTLLGARVEAVDLEGGRARGVVFSHEGREHRVRAALVALGANALFNPFILMRSGLEHPLLGRRLHEQVGLTCEVMLDGVVNFDGGSVINGFGYMLYDGPWRRERPACLIESWNRGILRTEHGRWREILPLRLVLEDLPRDDNAVVVDPDRPDLPTARFAGRSAYAEGGLATILEALEPVLAPLPVERIERVRVEPTEAHILGTTVMADDPDEGVVDRHLVHHRVRNLVVLGSSVFPTGAPAHPTLTLAALSLFAAGHLA